MAQEKPFPKVPFWPIFLVMWAGLTLPFLTLYGLAFLIWRELSDQLIVIAVVHAWIALALSAPVSLWLAVRSNQELRRRMAEKAAKRKGPSDGSM